MIKIPRLIRLKSHFLIIKHQNKIVFWGIYFSLCLLNNNAQCQARIDKNVTTTFQSQQTKLISLLLFFKSTAAKTDFINQFSVPIKTVLTPLSFMPTLLITGPKDKLNLQKISQFPDLMYIALNKPAGEKSELQPSKKVKVRSRYPGIDLWWNNGYQGQNGLVGLIDSGIAADHPAFFAKKIIINPNEINILSRYKNGVRSAHGTGVACIYAAQPQFNERVKGIAFKAPIILSTFAGEGARHAEDYWLTYSGLNWFLNDSSLKPTIINYSYGNGDITCRFCPDWSGMSKVVDYIINKYHILWVTSAGNNGFVSPRKEKPFSSTMTIPADSYNAITVANMDMYTSERATKRNEHAIRYTSSRGPTLIGRKKPDITAPGNETYTCAPDPKKYEVTYAKDMHYANGYRLMGGTSSAAPQVGGAILLLQAAGIKNPMAIKALLINSADSWTDSGKPGPNDPSYPYKGGHHQIEGSEWNPTYGWGYLNMEKAFYHRSKLKFAKLTTTQPIKEYQIKLRANDKITVVHERRVGFNKQGKLWALSRLKLEAFDKDTGHLIAKDDSDIDNVHQISLCSFKKCSVTRYKKVILRISLMSQQIEGSHFEKFVLAY